MPASGNAADKRRGVVQVQKHIGLSTFIEQRMTRLRPYAGQ
jgi:hypothetical protein